MFPTLTSLTGHVVSRIGINIDRHIYISVVHSMSSKKNKIAQSKKQVSAVSTPGPIQEKGDSVAIQFLVKPGAKHNSVTDIGDDAVGIQVAAPPVDGEANSELVKYVSKLLGVRKSDVILDKIKLNKKRKMETAREKYLITNTLVCLLKAIEGLVTTVELRNEKEVIGKIDRVDGFMNINMSDVTLRTLYGTNKFETFFVTGTNIRYVQIPDEVDMKRAMEFKLEQYNPTRANRQVQREIKDKAWQKMKKNEAQVQKKPC